MASRPILKSSTIQTIAGLATIVIAGFISRRFYGHYGITIDGWHYLQITRNVRFGILGDVLCDPTMRHHFFSTVPYALWALTGGAVASLKLYAGWKFFSALMGALTAIPAYLIGQHVFGRRAGLLGAALVALMPQLVRIGGFVLTDTPYIFLQTLGFYFALLAVERRSSRQGLWAGLTWGLASLTRTNGILVIPFFALYLGYKVLRDRKQLKTFARIYAMAFLGWGLMNLPYMAYLSSYNGYFTFSGKSTSGLHLRGVGTGQPAEPNGHDLDEGELQRFGRHPRSLSEYYIHFPKTALRVAVRSFRKGHMDDTAINYSFPLAYCLLWAIAFFSLAQGRRPERPQRVFYELGFVWAAGYYLADAAIIHMVERHYHHIYVLFCILAGVGLDRLFTLRLLSARWVQAIALLVIFRSIWMIYGKDMARDPYSDELSARAPLYNDREAVLKKVISAGHGIPDALKLGMSACLDDPRAKTEDDLQFRLANARRFQPEFALCRPRGMEARFCEELAKETKLTSVPLPPDLAADLGNLYSITYSRKPSR